MPATWITTSTWLSCAAIWKERSRPWCASIRTALRATFSVPPLAIAANSSRAHWRPSPRKTAASSSTCTTRGAASASKRWRNQACSPRFIFTSAASSIANPPASAWSSTKSASPTRSPSASTNPSPPTKPYDPAHNLHLQLSFRAQRGICFFFRRLPWRLFAFPIRHFERSEKSLLWFVRWLFGIPGWLRSCRLRRTFGRCFCRRRLGFRAAGTSRCRHRIFGTRLSRNQILAHFFKPLRPQATYRQQIIHALERAVRLPHLQNLFRCRRPDPRHLLQFLRRRRIDVHRLRRRLFLPAKNSRRTDQAEEKKEEGEPR